MQSVRSEMAKRKRSRSTSDGNSSDEEKHPSESTPKRTRHSYNMAFKLKIIDLVKKEQKSQREVVRTHNMDPKQVLEAQLILI
jgi:hypothetical protein